ncbi:MAG: patatin-like phospholipase family protein [Acidimicrobiales bacterium]
MAPDRPKIAFVLGGGGKWGAVEVGMMKALVEADVQPDVIVGTSIGAFNGAVFACDPGPTGLRGLEDLWAEVASSGLLNTRLVDRIRTFSKLRVAIQDPEPLREMLEATLPVRSFEDLAIPFQCVAASIERAAEHWFDSGPLIEALLASAAVPALFPPVKIGDEHFYDGGLVNSVPIDRAVDLGAQQIYVLQVGRVEQPLRPPTRVYEPALLSFEIARRHRFGAIRDRQIPGVDIHVLPSGNAVEFDDRRQLKWSDMTESDALTTNAYEASVRYLAEMDG